jgi:ABC-type phosphate transport system substrate-binding protein
MTSRILSRGLLAATLLVGGAAWAQNPGAAGGAKGGEASPSENSGGVGSPAGNGSSHAQPATRAEPAKMQQKKTDPKKNGTSQSESPGGENKNGQMK